MSASPDDKLRELLDDFGAAMLVTRRPDGALRSRPMAVAGLDGDGTLWFLTQDDSGKIDKINTDHHVNVAMQSAMRFVSISGKAALVKDSRKVEELWNEAGFLAARAIRIWSC